MVSFCAKFKTSFYRSKNYTKLASSERNRDRQRQRETDRDRQRQTETGRNRERQTETDRGRHRDRDFNEPFMPSNSALRTNKQQTLSWAGGQGQ